MGHTGTGPYGSSNGGPRDGWLERSFEKSKNDKTIISVAEFLRRLDLLSVKYLKAGELDKAKEFADLSSKIEGLFKLVNDSNFPL